MAKRQNWVNMRLMFSEEEHRKLKELKGSLTWEEFILKAAGIEE